MRLTNPDVATQREIADLLDAKNGHVDGLVDKHRQMIELPTEHRQALITAAVTGQLEVAGAVAA